MRYQIGDTVRIKSDLTVGLHYCAGLVNSMLICSGKQAIVDRISDKGFYRLNIDDAGFFWSPDMLEGYTGFYIGNHVLIDGVERVIVDIQIRNGDKYLQEYQLDDGRWYIESQLTRIDGFDYSKQTLPEEFDIGDYVIVNINDKVNCYGGTYSDYSFFVNERHLSENGRIKRISHIYRDGYCYLDNSTVGIFSSYVLKKVIPVAPKVGDNVIYTKDNSIYTVDKIEGNLCLCPSHSRTGITVLNKDLFVLTPVNITLNRDVFGVGKSGDEVIAYSLKDVDRCYVITETFISGELFPGEYVKGDS